MLQFVTLVHLPNRSSFNRIDGSSHEVSAAPRLNSLTLQARDGGQACDALGKGRLN
jgi:hypothetical protein